MSSDVIEMSEVTATSVQQTSHPMWFGPEGRPLFGVAHLPSGPVRGGVVLCPPLAKEQVSTYRGMKLLAQELAAIGFVVLRFDYYGVGDSSGAQDSDDIVEQWSDSVDHALSWMESTGCGDIALLGLRAGALLVDEIARRGRKLAAVVLWDPIGSGRMYVREQQAFYALSVGDDRPEEGASAVNDEVPMIGMTLSKVAAKTLSGMTLSGESPSVGRWMFAVRDGVTDKRTAAALERSGGDMVPVADMDEFVTPPGFLVTIPEPAVDTVVSWLDEAMPTRASESSFARPDFATTATFGDVGAPDAVIETIEALGPDNLFAIRSRRADAPVEKSLLLCATANDTHIGPSRIWVELARETAASGSEALRFDRRGTGESADVERSEHTPIYSDEAEEDVMIAARAVAKEPGDFVAAGICSGSWYAAYASKQLGAGSVVLINVVAWSWRRKRSARGKIVPADMGVPRSDPEWQRTPRARAKAFLQRNLPYAGWKLLGSRGITQVPEVLLRPLAKHGIRQTVILAPGDHKWFLDQRGEEGLKKLRRYDAAPTIITPNAGDHSGYHRAVRDAVSQHVLTGVLPVGTDRT